MQSASQSYVVTTDKHLYCLQELWSTNEIDIVYTEFITWAVQRGLQLSEGVLKITKYFKFLLFIPKKT